MDPIADHAAAAWLIFGVACLILEVATTSFVLAYFGLGALGASIAAALGAPGWFQLVEFVVVSVALLLLTRGLVVRRMRGGGTALPSPAAPTVVGRSGVVTIAIGEGLDGGQIRVGGEYWTARRAGGGPPIPVGAMVEVVAIDGIVARVEPREAAAPLPPGPTEAVR
jgi:membrane protein implicated in regulation of membrane protease activity